MSSKHTKILAEMIAPHKERAAKLLQPNPDLSQVSYLASKHQRFGTYDGNQLNRYRIMTGIRFTADKTPYEDLIRYLLTEEIKDRETNSFQGLSNDLLLGVWLMKKFHNKSNAELFSRAKKANFDTYCGFNPDTINEEYFKDNITHIDISECIRLALHLDGHDALSPNIEKHDYAGRLIELWKTQQTTWDEYNLKQLATYEKRRINPAGELDALLNLLPLKQETANDRDICSLLNNIAKKHIELGQIPEAFTTVSRLLPRLVQVEGWENVGLGRSIMETCMDVIIEGDMHTASQIWSVVKPHATAMSNMHWNLYEKSAFAADKMGDDAISETFLQRLEDDRKKMYTVTGPIK